MEYVSRKRGCQQPPAPGSALSEKQQLLKDTILRHTQTSMFIM